MEMVAAREEDKRGENRWVLHDGRGRGAEELDRPRVRADDERDMRDGDRRKCSAR